MNWLFRDSRGKSYIHIDLAIHVLCFSLLGQNVLGAVAEIPPPEQETFVSVDALAVPWRSTACKDPYKRDESECTQIKAAESVLSHRLNLFSADGSNWYRFSVFANESDYFIDTKKIGFEPFATSFKDSPQDLILRLVGESPTWYEVEINETSRATKYILKKDRLWAKVSWGFWLLRSPRITIDSDQTQLHDRPNGSKIEGGLYGRSIPLVFLKIDGEWALARGFIAAQPYQGWIRWRNGRDLLVGCNLNQLVVPESP